VETFFIRPEGCDLLRDMYIEDEGKINLSQYVPWRQVEWRYSSTEF